MDLQTNASKAVEMDRKIKKLIKQFDALKATLIEQMRDENVTVIEIKQSKVCLCQRKIKDFGPEIAERELQIKAEKKMLETLGKFTIASITDFIQVR
jgi:archaellum biogenesis ATPase FlaH